jgi:alpha-1,2-mannosyltransferase
MTAQSSLNLIWQRLDRVTLVLLAVLGSVVISAAIDMAIWWHNGFTLTELNGSSLRVYDGLNYHGFINRPLADSWIPMQGALEVLRGPSASELYETLFFQDKVKFQYPPTSLVYFLALDELGLTDALTLNNINGVLVIVNVGLVLWLFAVSTRRSTDETSPPLMQQQHLLLLAAVAFMFYPVLRGYYIGQIQIWIDVLFTAACLSWVTGRPLLAGVLIGLAATIKPQLGLFLVWGLLWRQWPFVWGVLASALGIGAISLALFGLHNHIEYLRVLSYIGSHGEIYYANQSINGLLNRLVFSDIDNVQFEHHLFAPYSGFVASLTLAATLFLLFTALKSAVTDRGGKPGIFDFGLLAICVTISSPVAWEHHYGIMLPLLVIALAALTTRSRAPQPDTGTALLIASWALLGNYFAFLNVFKSSWLNVLQSPMLAGGLLLVLLYLKLQGAERKQQASLVPDTPIKSPA